MSFLIFQSWTLILSNGWEHKCKAWEKKQIWQPALRKLFSFPAPDDRQEALKFLLQTMKKFQVVFLLRFCPDLHSLFPVFTHWMILFKTGLVCEIRQPSPPAHPPSPLLPHPVPLRIIWNGKLILTSRRVNKRKKQKYIYLNKLPYISVWKQTFFRGWKENENKTKSVYK